MKRFLLAFVAVIATIVAATAQEINLDKTVRAGQLQLFQDFKDPKVYYYLPNKAGLAVDADGKPKFSFLRYVRNVAGAAGTDAAKEGEGGGIVHCLVALSVPPEMLDEAKRELSKIVPGATIAGPIIYRSGKFGLVSSFKQENGELTTRVLGLGNAPILEGDKAAVSMQLTKMGATLLWNSFQTSTPDVSFTFEMEIAGYRNGYEATVTGQWDSVYKHRAFAAGIATKFGGAEIKDVLDEMVRTDTLKVTIKGTDEKLDGVVNSAEAKIMEAMFDRQDAGGGGLALGSPDASGGMLDKALKYMQTQQQETRTENQEIDRQYDAVKAREAARRAETTPAVTPAPAAAGAHPAGDATIGAQAAVETKKDPAPQQAAAASQPPPKPSYSSPPAFSLLASYEMKKVHNSGTINIQLSRSTLDKLNPTFSENIGNLTKWVKDPMVFRSVNLDDDLYKQREVVVMLDGQNSADFSKYVNFVTVQMRKKHGDRSMTQDEIRIDRTNFSTSGGLFRFTPYGWKGDTDRSKWLEYEYNTVWSFFGGKTVEEGWKPTTNVALSVTPTYSRRSISIEADPSRLTELGVRLATIKFTAKLNDTVQNLQATIRVAQDAPPSTAIEYIHSPGDNDYTYEISWRMKDGTTKTSGPKKGSEDVIFADELPQ